ncbi:MAG TPA: hypothetical protein VNI83_13210 [Vicinamibacterales bacterium]|nr:hypothetical protein [Vicinamibacterales bacterium]
MARQGRIGDAWRRLAAATLLAVMAAAAAAGCSARVREGQSPAYIIIDALEAASGAEEDQFEGELNSDVITGGTVFEDAGRVTMRLALKDVGAPSAPATPTANNHITVTRYRVVYKRADGRNTPGVDVPHPFDGAITVTLSSTSTPVQATFTLVRVQAKIEPPLAALTGGRGGTVLSTIAEVTFYGRDQTGRSVSATGQISIHFADWGDPES